MGHIQGLAYRSAKLERESRLQFADGNGKIRSPIIWGSEENANAVKTDIGEQIIKPTVIAYGEGALRIVEQVPVTNTLVDIGYAINDPSLPHLAMVAIPAGDGALRCAKKEADALADAARGGAREMPHANLFHGRKPKYNVNPAHHPNNPRKTPLPSDAENVYKKAIPNAKGSTWYNVGSDGQIYRYFTDSAGNAHFSGIVRLVDLDNEIQKRLRGRLRAR